MASPGRNVSGSSNNTGSHGRSSPASVRLIQEIFQDYNEMGYKQALRELDAAFEERCPLIVIEPMRLGNETARYIGIGNFLHKASVLLGASSTTLTLLWPHRWPYWTAVGGSGLLAFSLYSLDWRTDPACKYQVEKDPDTLARLNINHLSSSSVVVLVYKDDTRRKLLHTTVTIVSLAVIGTHLYKIWRQ